MCCQPDAAVGVQGTGSVQVGVVLAEPAEVHRLDGLDPRLQLGDELVLDLVEHPCSLPPGNLALAARQYLSISMLRFVDLM